MTNAIEIRPGKYQTIREYNGQRVVTFKDIDTVHERPEGTARKRFNDNRKRFVEGVDFYLVSPSVFRTAECNSVMNARQRNDVTVITETGYLMLVKSFTDNLAWEVQRALVTGYFKGKASTIDLERPLTVDDYLRAASIIAGCKSGRIPWVVDLLRRGGIDVSDITPEIPEGRKCYTLEEREKLADDAVTVMRDYVDNGHSQADLAKELGLALPVVNRYVNGKGKPKPERAKNIITIITRVTEG